MNIAETVMVMARLYEYRTSFASSILLSGTTGAQTVTGVRRGRVATMLTHDGTTSRSLWSRARYCDGGSPTISVKRELNEPSDVQPTAKHVSVTDSPCRNRALARSMRRVMRYE